MSSPSGEIARGELSPLISSGQKSKQAKAGGTSLAMPLLYVYLDKSTCVCRCGEKREHTHKLSLYTHLTLLQRERSRNRFRVQEFSARREEGA